MKIRTATLEDDKSISELICRLSKRYICQDCTPSGAKRLLNSMHPEKIQGYLNSGYQYYLAEINQQLVGVIGIIAKQPLDDCHLYHLFVDEQFQHQGIARKLWLTAITKKKITAQQLVVTVNSSVNALKFYQQLGFVAASPQVFKNGIPSIPMNLTIN